MAKERRTYRLDRETGQLTDTTSLQTIRNYLAVTATYFCTLNDNYLAVNTAGGAVTINLVSAARVKRGFEMLIKDQGNNAAVNNITVDASGAETIDGALTRVINVNRASLRIICNGTGWDVV